VYLSMPGFASTDVARRDIRAFEGVVMATCGVFSDMGLNRSLMGTDPSYSPLSLASSYSSALAVSACTLALYAREKTGMGDTIEVPLAAGLMDALVYNSMDVGDTPSRYKCVRELELERRQEHNLPCNVTFPELLVLLDPFYCTYWCKDERPFYVVAPCHTIHQTRCLKALGIWDKLCAMGLPRGDVYKPPGEWIEEGDKNAHGVLGTYPISDTKWMTILKEEMTAAFKQRPALEWERIFGSMKVTGAATRTCKEWINSEHANAVGLAMTIQDEEYGEMKIQGPAAWHMPAMARASPEQQMKVKAEAQAKNHCTIGGEWLKGINILDLCNVIAGPIIGGTLSRFGANVIKMDMTKPTYDGLVAVLMGLPPNRGKRSLLADLKNKRGKEVLYRMVQWADVVLVNQTPSQLQPLGVDEATLKKYNPSVILSVFDGLGGPGIGHRSDSVAYDDLLQACTGVMERFGGSLDTPEEHAHLGTIDVVSGFLGAISVCMSIFKRARTGVPDIARASLAGAGGLIQCRFMVDVAGEDNVCDREDVFKGHACAGEGALYRWYAASDQNVFIATAQSDHAVACKALNQTFKTGDLSKLSDQEVAEKLQAAFSQMTGEALVNKLATINIGAAVQGTMAGMRNAHSSDTAEWKYGVEGSSTFHFETIQDHPMGCHVTIFSPCSILSENAVIKQVCPAPQYGIHTREILKEVGYNDAEIQNLVNEKAVKDNWSEEYLVQGDPWAAQQAEYLAYVEGAAKVGARAATLVAQHASAAELQEASALKTSKL